MLIGEFSTSIAKQQLQTFLGWAKNSRFLHSFSLSGDEKMVEAKSQKVRFLLGVFDENDDRRFDENEFVEMIQALLRGMGAMLLGDQGRSAIFWSKKTPPIGDFFV